MPWFKALVRGENFLLRWEVEESGEVTLEQTGFYTTRVVRARDRKTAEADVVELLRADPGLEGSQNAPGDSPMLYVEKLQRVTPFAARRCPNAGFTFFVGEDARSAARHAESLAGRHAD